MLYLKVLNKILHRIYLTGFWIYHGFKICQGSEYITVLNMSGFIKKPLLDIDAWQGSDYSSGSAYTRVLNMSGLHKVLKNSTSLILDVIPNIPQVLNMPHF